MASLTLRSKCELLTFTVLLHVELKNTHFLLFNIWLHGPCYIVIWSCSNWIQRQKPADHYSYSSWHVSKWPPECQSCWPESYVACTLLQVAQCSYKLCLAIAGPTWWCHCRGYLQCGSDIPTSCRGWSCGIGCRGFSAVLACLLPLAQAPPGMVGEKIDNIFKLQWYFKREDTPPQWQLEWWLMKKHKSVFQVWDGMPQ